MPNVTTTRQRLTARPDQAGRADSAFRRTDWQSVPAHLLAGLVAASLLCSCAVPPERLGTTAIMTPQFAPAPPPIAGKTDEDVPETVGRIANPSQPTKTTPTHPSLIQQTAAIMPLAKESTAEPHRPQRVARAVTFTPAHRRIESPRIAGQPAPISCPPAPGCRPCGPDSSVGRAAIGLAPGAVGPRGIHADEYLCDGGDRALPVHYGRKTRFGLNTEDTVAEWTAPNGKQHVTPSNKVCVYAPRFGEVRAFTEAVGGVKVTTVLRTEDAQRGVGFATKTGLEREVQNLHLNTARVRSRISGMKTDATAAGVGQITTIALNVKDITALVGSEFLATGVIREGEEAFIADGIDAATAWTRAQFPVISATTISAGEVHAEFEPAVVTGTKDMGQPGYLRIVKLADKETASPGDVVTFTIRYDNLGDKPIHHVRIIDNLTGRLEFIPDSAVSSRAGELTVEPNGEGSLVLTFNIEGAVKGKSGGTVSFKARVR